jgi:hypothetical protein
MQKVSFVKANLQVQKYKTKAPAMKKIVYVVYIEFALH